MADYRIYISALRKCAIEHDNDRTFTGQIIISDLCRDTANLLEELEQEPSLDKIRKEVLEYIDDLDIAYEICDIFDKYKTESEEANRNDD